MMIVDTTNHSRTDTISSNSFTLRWVDISQAKQIKLTDGIDTDVTVTPNTAILEDIPPTEIQTLQAQNAQVILALI